ncbi:hypothetical protein Bbelb_022520 [Branchiostoma belcheri]|nr:hypothetical protein Bbelb_022520 [Branchiostoma belcheri]
MAAARSLDNVNSNKEDQPAVLLVNDEYSASKREASSLDQQVGKTLKEHVPDIPVFSMVLQATEQDKLNAQQDGVKLLLPKLDPDDPRTDPTLDWLTFDHNLKYPHLPQKVRSIVGHTDVTGRASVKIKKERYPHANVILFTEDIPEDTEYYKGDEKAMGIGKKEDSILEDAQEADVVFSLGNKIFDHFENQFRAIPASKRPQHVKFVPKPSKIFEDAEVEYKDTETMVVLSIGRVKGVEKLKGYDLAAETLSIVAEKIKIKWHVIGFNKDDFEATKAILKHCKSANLQVTFLPYGTQKDICKEMMKATCKSGLADFIHEHVDELHHSIVDMDGSDEGVTVRRWADAVERVLKHNRAEFKTAARGKQQLLSTKYWEEFHQQLIKACTGNAEEQPVPVQVQSVVQSQETEEGVTHLGAQKRKRSSASIDETEGSKALKTDENRSGETVELDGTLSAILTEEYISQELVEICGGMPLHVHIEVDEEDFQRGADISHGVTTGYVTMMDYPEKGKSLGGQTPPHNHGELTLTVDQTAALSADSQQMELLQQDPTTGTTSPGFDNQETSDYEEPGETDVPPEISELVSLDIRELEQLMGKPRKKTFSVSSQSSGYGTGPSGSAPSRPFSYTGEIDTKDTLEVKGLLAELNTPVVKQDKVQQFDLYCQIGDLYRTKLRNSQSALQYYQNMLDCSQELSEDTKQAKAYNRLGLTCDILGLQQEAFRNHEKALAIYRVETKNETNICVAYKNLASSLALSGQVSDAKINYESALAVAMETGNKTEQMDIYCKLGDLHREQLHEPQESHKYYTEMLALARDLGRKDWEGLAYNSLGLAHYDMGEYEESLEWDKKYLKMSQESGDKAGQITAHQNIAGSYKALGKLDLARSHYQSAMTIAMETGNKTEQMDIYLQLGDLHRKQLHEPQESHKYYTEMLALARDLGRKEEERLAYNRLGHAHYDMGEYKESLEWHKKDLKMSQETEDKTKQITAHKNIAGSNKALGKLDLARSHYQSAMTIAMETGNKTQQMDIYCKLGDLHRKQLHEPQESHKYYTEMLALARDLGRKDREGLAYNRLGLVHYVMGEHEESLEWHNKYLKMRQESGDKTGQITAHQCLADSYEALGNLDLARSHYQSAMTIAMETGNKTQQMDIYCELGDLHREQLHEPQESHKYYTEMLALARDLGRKDWEGLAYNRLGLAHYDMGEYEESLEWHKKDLKMSQESGDKTEQIIPHQRVAGSYKALGKLDLARSHYQSAMTIAMETENKQKQEDIAKELANL